MNWLPLIPIFAASRERRRALLPMALPGLANLPASQAGAIAVVTADGALRREAGVAAAQANAALAQSDAALTQTISVAVAKGATLVVDDFKGIPRAHEIVLADPNILAPPPTELSAAQLAEVKALIAQLAPPKAETEEAGRTNGKSEQAPKVEEVPKVEAPKH